MEIQEFVKQQGEFLKADYVKENPGVAFEIVGEAELIENKFGNWRLHIPVKATDQQFVFDCSKTNARIIAAKYGNETKKWLGRMLELETYKTKTSDGKMTLAISVKEE